uniref:Uncharacterized protein n=1 Tax=viral metagenome TaxID=1070528 RepID=A0A6M3JSV6_9ZZZZ
MSNYDDFNFPAFHKYAKKLEQLGYVVWNPAAKETLEGTDKPDWDKIPTEWSCPTGAGTNEDRTPGDVRWEDFSYLLAQDGIALMPGWKESWGARGEVLVAMSCGKACFEIVESSEHQAVLVPLHPQTTIETRVVNDAR